MSIDAADVKLPDDNQRVSNLIFKVTQIIYIVDSGVLVWRIVLSKSRASSQPSFAALPHEPFDQRPS